MLANVQTWANLSKNSEKLNSSWAALKCMKNSNSFERSFYGSHFLALRLSLRNVVRPYGADRPDQPRSAWSASWINCVDSLDQFAFYPFAFFNFTLPKFSIRGSTQRTGNWIAIRRTPIRVANRRCRSSKVLLRIFWLPYATFNATRSHQICIAAHHRSSALLFRRALPDLRVMASD